MLLTDRYRLLGPPLGSGSYGAVYLAEDTRMPRQVAVKLLHREHLPNQRVTARFRRELEALCRVADEHVVQVLDVGEDDEHGLWFVMEHVEGTPLSRLVDGRPLPWRWVRPVAQQLAAALAAIHRAGIVHRDVKPQNIMLVERRGQPDLVKVLDFGIAALDEPEGSDRVDLTATQVVVGTPAYMSPEQSYMRADRERRGLRVDARTDLYQLGLVLYELAAGRRPFHGDRHELVIAHRQTPPVPLRRVGGVDAPEAFCALVDRLLSKDPAARPANAEAVQAQLQAMAALPAHAPSRGGPSVDATLVAPAEAVSTDVDPLDDPAFGPRGIGPGARWALLGALAGGLAVGAFLFATRAGPTPAGADVAVAPATAVAPPAERDPEPGGDTAVVAAGQPEAAPTVEADAPVEAEPLVVTLRLTSEPTGATVLVGGEEVGRTPLDVALDARVAVTHAVELQRRGYRTERLEEAVGPDGAGAVIERHAALRRRAPRPRPPAATRPAATPPRAPPASDPFERF